MGEIKKGIKMIINPEQSRKVQEICFENDIGWAGGNYVKHLDKPFIFINTNGSICHGRISQLFNIDKNEEVSAELFIRTNGTCVEPKTLSEYLKENNAYESFVENCVESVLLNPKSYECIRGIAGNIGSFFSWYKSKEGFDYWNNLQSNIPEPIEYDMDEIIFTEVDKRIAEQKTTTKCMVFVEGQSTPKKVHDSYDSAEKEAKRLSAKEIGCNVMVLSVVKAFKSKVIVEAVR